MQAYLAEKYMSGPKADAILARSGGDKKKKKRKAVAGASSSASTGVSFIKDDDLSGWSRPEQDDDEEDANDAVVASDRGFKKRRTAGTSDSGAAESSGWQTVRDSVKKEESPPADERPQVVGEPAPTPFTGGLVTRAQLQKARPAPKRDQDETAEEVAAQQETVYRDGSGRKIDVKAERAEAARKKREREEKEAQKMQWGKGLVQRGDEEKLRKEMERMQTRDVARYKDDKDLNEEQKAVERWNDPAAAFLSKKRTKGPKKPEYVGPQPPPNRFGIKPGYRWDGVDRGNGFESKLYQRMNERKRRGLESYQWSVDDM